MIAIFFLALLVGAIVSVVVPGATGAGLAVLAFLVVCGFGYMYNSAKYSA